MSGKKGKSYKQSGKGTKKVQNLKERLHPRNKNRNRYVFEDLISANAELKQYVGVNQYGSESIDFANPAAVKALNKSILISAYGLEYWDIPEGYLCPPIPGRADYIHHIADLLCQNNFGKIPKGEKVKCLDVGVGANCIYPIIGYSDYGWSFIGSDVDAKAIESANRILASNGKLANFIECRQQKNSGNIFKGILTLDEQVDVTICNPPFHASRREAEEGSLRKIRNLGNAKTNVVKLNFGGQSNELWCKGGEKEFIRKMIFESKEFAKSCFWFSTLVAKQAHLKSIYKILKEVEAVKVQTIAMGQGNKSSRIVAWTFLSPEEQKKWKINRWKG